MIHQLPHRYTAILFTAMLPLAAFFAAAQDEPPVFGPDVLVRTAPDVPLSGSQWTLSLLIRHAVPEEVTVFAPPFTGSLFLDQVLKGPRLVNPATGQALAEKNAAGNEPVEIDSAGSELERWTAMEYRFMLNSPGTITLDPFTVVTPQGRTETAPLAIRVRQASAAADLVHLRMIWEKVPAGLRTGESAVFVLRLNSRDTPLPEPAFFMPSIPQGVILERERLLPEEQAEGLALRLKLIPLAASAFTLPARQLRQGSLVFEIPALRIPVSAAPPIARNAPPAEQPLQAKTTGAADDDPQEPPAAFPDFSVLAASQSSLLKKHRDNCETVYSTAKNLWERGYMAAALALLRRNERDNPAGTLFTPLRREAERRLGLEYTKDETAKKFSLWGKAAQSAVARETVVRRIPDEAGEEAARLKEGQPLRIVPGGTNKAWVRITSRDESGVAGWVPEEKIILY
jgi:hypothetical protein